MEEALSIPMQWEQTIPTRFKDGWLHWTKHRTKFIEFLETHKPDGTILNSLAAQSSAREENEPFDEYKARLRFTKQLLKFRRKI